MPTVIPSRPCVLLPGEQIPLAVSGVGGGATFEWSASDGMVTPLTGPTVTFRAPSQSGQVFISVTAKEDGESAMGTLICEVLPHTPTPSLASSASATPTLPPSETPTLPPSETPPQPSETPTPPPTPTPNTEVVIEAMDFLPGWEVYTDGEGSVVNVTLVEGEEGNAIRLDFELVPYGFVGISKLMSPDVLPELPNTSSIVFSYRGGGAPNSIELKLIYPRDAQDQEAIFSFMQSAITASTDWSKLTVPWGAFVCWGATGCDPDIPIDLEKVRKIDFAISNKKPDTPGIGYVILDNVRGLLKQ